MGGWVRAGGRGGGILLVFCFCFLSEVLLHLELELRTVFTHKERGTRKYYNFAALR